MREAWHPALAFSTRHAHRRRSALPSGSRARLVLRRLNNRLRVSVGSCQEAALEGGTAEARRAEDQARMELLPGCVVP